MNSTELQRIHEQIASLRATTDKLSREPFWYPLAIATALIATVASTTAVLLYYA